MTETSNISRMAEKLSKEIFEAFGWHTTGPKNYAWQCNKLEHRKGGSRDKHPTDVVFWYDCPYEDRRIYLNCDLKSYGKDSIQASAIENALASLARAVECTRVSKDWQNTYVYQDHSWVSHGLLFVYNHDDEYDGGAAFSNLTRYLNKFSIARDERVYIMGPKDILYLYNVVTDLKLFRSDNNVPPEVHNEFFLPDQVQRPKVSTNRRVVPVEGLLAPWLLCEIRWGSGQHLVAYCRGAGQREDEWVYFLDYLLHYQLVNDSKSISIRLPEGSADAAVYFARGKESYIKKLAASHTFARRYEQIDFTVLDQKYRTFSEIQLGCENG